MSEQKQVLVGESDLQKRIVGVLGTKGPMTREDLCAELGFTGRITLSLTVLDRYGHRSRVPTGRTQAAGRTTVYDQLRKLMDRNIVDKYPVGNNKRGRPKVVFSLRPGIVAG